MISAQAGGPEETKAASGNCRTWQNTGPTEATDMRKWTIDGFRSSAFAVVTAALVIGIGAGASATAGVPSASRQVRLAAAVEGCSPSLLADGEPRAVVILADGISSSVKAGSYTPADVTGAGWGQGAGYCVPYTGQTPGPTPRAAVAAAGLPAPLESLYADYAGGLLPGYKPHALQSQLLTNVLARAGAALVPFSYRGATLHLPAPGASLADAVLTVAASSSSDPGAIVPQTAAATLEREIASIHNVWPATRILVVGHSEAGLVAEFWWHDFWLGSGRDQVWSVFSLDGPLNGVAGASVCESGACGPVHIQPSVAEVWLSLWRENQSRVDASLIRADQRSGDRFIAVGTQSDPVYDLGDAPLNNGLGSQMWHTGACVSDRFGCNYHHAMDLSSACPTNSTSGPSPSMDGHGLVMNCANVEQAILGRLETAEAAAQITAVSPVEPLNAVTCAASSCTAVGWYIRTTPTLGIPSPAIERFGAGGWRLSPSPPLSIAVVPTYGLAGVDCLSSGSCVAVGTRVGDGKGQPYAETLVERLSGGNWSVMPSPNVDTANFLMAVACTGQSACVAVGSSANQKDNVRRTLILVFDGRRWSVLPSPDPSPSYNALYGVSCARNGRCVAVGNTVEGTVGRPLIITIAGGQARVASGSSLAGSGATILWGVSCGGRTACIAVGSAHVHGSIGAFAPLAVRIVAGRSSVMTSPALPAGSSDAYLNAISCLPDGACMAVGGQTRQGATLPLAEVLDTRGRWSDTGAAPPSGAGLAGDLLGVACSQSGCVAVGAAGTARRPSNLAAPLVETYDGATWWLTPLGGPADA